MEVGVKDPVWSEQSGLLVSIGGSGMSVSWEDAGVTQENKGKGETKLNSSIAASQQWTC